jgi:hypothetical protein
MIPLFLGALGLVLLICMWAVGEQEFRTKLIMTGLYVALWVFWIFDPTGGWIAVAAKALWCLVAGYGTFGSRFGRRR